MQGDIILPDNIVILRGQEYNFYYRNFIVGNLNNFLIDIESEVGRQYSDFYRIGSEESLDCDGFEFTVSVRDWEFKQLAQKKIEVIVAEAADDEYCPVLCIGDSMTRAGLYVKRLNDLLPKVVTLGTRTYDGGITCTEGRGGWRADTYFKECIGDGTQSPFMFPVGINAVNYMGRLSFWSNVVYENPRGYKFDGFGKIAKNWNNKDFDFTETGFPKNPTNGMVVLDDEEKLIQYKSGAWEEIGAAGWEFNFSKYMERYKCAFMRNGEMIKPKIVTLLFGANEFQFERDVLSKLDEYIDVLKAIMASVRQYDKTIKFVINMPIIGANQDSWGKQTGCKGSCELYRYNMQQVGKRIIDEWDNARSRQEGIFVCPMLACLDVFNNFDTEYENVNNHSDKKIERQANWVHPNSSGYYQMGDMLAASLAYISQM